MLPRHYGFSLLLMWVYLAGSWAPFPALLAPILAGIGAVSSIGFGYLNYRTVADGFERQENLPVTLSERSLREISSVVREELNASWKERDHDLMVSLIANSQDFQYGQSDDHSYNDAQRYKEACVELCNHLDNYGFQATEVYFAVAAMSSHWHLMMADIRGRQGRTSEARRLLKLRSKQAADYARTLQRFDRDLAAAIRGRHASIEKESTSRYEQRNSRRKKCAFLFFGCHHIGRFAVIDRQDGNKPVHSETHKLKKKSVYEDYVSSVGKILDEWRAREQKRLLEDEKLFKLPPVLDVPRMVSAYKRIEFGEDHPCSMIDCGDGSLGVKNRNLNHVGPGESPRRLVGHATGMPDYLGTEAYQRNFHEGFRSLRPDFGAAASNAPPEPDFETTLGQVPVTDGAFYDYQDTPLRGRADTLNHLSTEALLGNVNEGSQQLHTATGQRGEADGSAQVPFGSWVPPSYIPPGQGSGIHGVYGDPQNGSQYGGHTFFTAQGDTEQPTSQSGWGPRAPDTDPTQLAFTALA